MALLTRVLSTCIRAMLVPCTCFMLAGSAVAGTFWVSPTGTAAWANCTGGTPLSGTAACSLGTANTNAAAGDTVYLRGGSYSYSGQFDTALAPTHSGTCAGTCLGGVGANRIIFSAYTGETPLIQNTNASNVGTGLYMHGVNWVKITGISFKNFMGYPGLLDNGSSYNEISYNSFTFDPGFQLGTWFSIGGTSSPWSTHNWFHHNYISSIHAANPCGESIDLIRIGNEESPPNSSVDDYNTVENNYLEYGGHSTLLDTSRHNVIKNNIAHNEPWISGCVVTPAPYNFPVPIGTSTSSVTIPSSVPSSVSLTTQTGLGITAGSSEIIGIAETSNLANAMNGSVTSYNSSTGALVVNVTGKGGSGTHSDWTIDYTVNAPYYDDAASNNLYGHRNFSIGQTAGQSTSPIYSLVEGNRLGFAGVNPNNGGAMGLDLEAPYIIARYNFVYGSMGSGIDFKYGHAWDAQAGGPSGAVYDHVYNNTSYHNGHGWNAGLYGDNNLAYNGEGISQYSQTGAATNNVVKNNLVYGNGYSGQWDICGLGWYPNTNCAADSIDIVSNNWLTSNGDPQFTNPALTDPTSQNLFSGVHGYTATAIPDLTLQASSPTIDGGTWLTTASGSGTGSTSLVVADPWYFQDGTWGSDLARGVTFFPDWIAIGTVSNTVQIIAINYRTNTITLASPTTWSAGAAIWLYKKSDGSVVLTGSAPDYGASEYGVTAPPQGLQAIVQ